MLVIDQAICYECGGCVPLCPDEALFLSFDQLLVDLNLCSMCGICENFCPMGAIEETEDA